MIDAVAFLRGLPDWQATVLVLGVSVGAAVLVEVVGIRLLRALVRRTESEYDNIVFDAVRWPLVVTVALGGVYLWVWTFDQQGSTSVFLAQEQLVQFFGNPSATLIVLLWAYAVNRIVNEVVAEVETKDQYYEFAPVFSNVFTLVVAVAGLFLVLTIWNVEITPLLGAAGVAGIAVGFAAKDTVANFFGGLALYFDDTYKLGDYVELDSGVKGTVVKVGVRSTTLMTRDEVLVTVPNSVLNNARISNWSAPDSRKRIRVPVSVAYGTDVDEFEELVLGLADEEDRVLESPKPRMRFRRFGDSALEYELLCWVRSPTEENRAIHRLNRDIYKTLNERGIEIPYPKRDVSVSSGSVRPDAVPGLEAEPDGGVDEDGAE